MSGNGTLSLSLSEKERHAQIQEARRLSQLETTPENKPEASTFRNTAGSRPYQNGGAKGKPVIKSAAKKKYVPKGHDGTLKELQASKTPVFIESLNGDVINGVIVGSDRYTISVKTTEEGGDFVEHIYKHGIFSFGKSEPEAVPAQEQVATND